MDKLVAVISRFRNDLDIPALPFIAGELGHYNQNKQAFNKMLQSLPARAIHTIVVRADGLPPNADSIHFNTNSARLLGSRYAAAMKELRK